MGRITVLFIIFLWVINTATHSQYYISSNEKLFLANASKADAPECALTTAHNFFTLAQMGQRSAWEQLLASSCYKEKETHDYVNGWFDQLNLHKDHYTILRTSSPKTNQKIIHYVSEKSPEKKKNMVLIKEKGHWKICHAGL